jgi:hypothetical protein
LFRDASFNLDFLVFPIFNPTDDLIAIPNAESINAAIDAAGDTANSLFIGGDIGSPDYYDEHGQIFQTSIGDIVVYRPEDSCLGRLGCGSNDDEV